MANEELPAENNLGKLGWISASERMPSQTADEILVYSRSHRVSISTGYHVHVLAKAAKEDHEQPYYTHWMPLPEAPK